MKNKIIIAFDFGTYNIGIAIGQEITQTAQPLATVKTSNKQSKWLQIEQILNEWKPQYAIIGLPLNMNGSEQLITVKTRNFAKYLNTKFSLPFKFHDERLTTIEAKSKIFNFIGYQGLSKKKIHSISAVIILESWLKKNK